MEVTTMNCAVNGRSGREGELSLARTDAPKRIVVVGAGPGGLEAARVAALRGHRVALYERAHFLGGALVAAATVHPENQPLLDFLVREVRRLPVEIHTGRTLTPESIRALEPDAVVVATGGRVVARAIPGDDRRNVFTGPQLRRLLERVPARLAQPAALRAATRLWMPLGRRVVLVGADLAALELAEFLAGRGRRVTLLDAADGLAPEIGLKRRTEHMDRLDRLGVVVNTGVLPEQITATGIRIRGEDGRSGEIAADSIVIAGELEADTALFDAVESSVPASYAVGDCSGLGLIQKAIEEATRVACAL